MREAIAYVHSSRHGTVLPSQLDFAVAQDYLGALPIGLCVLAYAVVGISVHGI
jgi:hypothetical protein